MCRVSVIVPVYQVEAYLPRCLDSILAQTFTDFELILVNDGTRDGCPAIMQRYAERDSRIRQIHKENGGLSSARNAGLDVARGEYVAFIDSDDYVEKTLLADTVALADETGAQLVVFNYARFDEQGDRGPFLRFDDETIDLEKRGLCAYFWRYFMAYRHGHEAWSKLWRRDVIEEHGLRFEPNDEIFAEDTMFTAMYLMHTRRIAAKNAVYVHYLQRGDSIMGLGKPRLCERLTTLAIRLWTYARACGRERELRDVLPVFCYDKLICKGIKLDGSADAAASALTALSGEAPLRELMRRLLGPGPLLAYTLRTGRGLRSQITARLFAWQMLRGNGQAAVRLIRPAKAREEEA